MASTLLMQLETETVLILPRLIKFFYRTFAYGLFIKSCSSSTARPSLRILDRFLSI